MSKILILDDFTINQIAAGEVIERPSSIVKELVENSIDAACSSVTVETKGGGISFIRVSDNGEGMDERDACLAFERHATSKIHAGIDLAQIASLGFRGEALASIAAVSQVEMFTGQKDSITGTHIVNHGGNMITVKGVGCPEGTTVIVRNLFYNIPARLKFLKSQRAEAASITDLLSKLILSRPSISFKYIHEDKTIYHSPGNGSLLQAIASVYGKDTMQHVMEIEKHDPIRCISLRGYLGSPSIARMSRNHQTYFINGRYIKNYMLSKCLSEAYRSRLVVNHFPWAVMCIKLPADMVDINVHPAKTQVRFREEGYIYRIIYKWVKEALEQQPYIPRVNDDISLRMPIDNIEQEQTTLFSAAPYKPFASNNIVGIREDRVFEETNSTEYSPALRNIKDAHIRLIGSAFSTYIIAQGQQHIFLIDQHAAHERMLYDELKKLIQNREVAIQQMLAPLIVEISQTEQGLLPELMDALSALGFDVEIFDRGSVVIRGIPSALVGMNVREFFRDLMDHMENNPYSAQPDIRIKHIIKLACNKAVKARDPLSESEMLHLINSIARGDTQMTCPHGRPIIISISQHELEVMFKRIQ